MKSTRYYTAQTLPKVRKYDHSRPRACCQAMRADSCQKRHQDACCLTRIANRGKKKAVSKDNKINGIIEIYK